MAKRFTDTEKWKKPFIRSMKAPYKLLWLYILDECDHAGIWQVDFEVAQIKIGEKLNSETAKEFFAGKIYEFDGGEKWYIPDFIEFQYGELSEQNRAHNSVIRILEKYNLNEIKPLISPLQGAMDKDKDKDKDKEKDKYKDKDKEKQPEIELIYPFNSERFKTVWELLINEPKWKKKSKTALQASLMKLSNYPEQEAIQMIENSIAGGWQGIFELNNKSNGKQTIQNKQSEREEMANRLRRELGIE